MDAPLANETQTSVVNATIPECEFRGYPLLLTDRFPSEAEEPILKKCVGRFILFPLRYHEVCVPLFVVSR